MRAKLDLSPARQPPPWTKMIAARRRFGQIGVEGERDAGDSPVGNVALDVGSGVSGGCAKRDLKRCDTCEKGQQIKVHASASKRASRLMLSEVHEIGPNYAETLRRWRENFDAQIDEIRALGYDKRFERTWHFCLAFCEAGSRT